MTTISRKAFRDAWHERTQSAFVIASIAAGVTAVLALLGSYAVLTRELDRGYLATNPASAILHTEAVDKRMLAAVLTDPEVRTAEARRALFGRIKTGPAQWRNLLLFAIPNYQDIRLNKFVSEQGAWPPATGDMLIERDALHVARVGIGDVVTVRTDHGQPRPLRVSGRVHDVGQPQARMENSVYGYITVATLAEIGEKPVLDLLLIQVSNDKLNQQHIRQVTARVKQRLQAQGYRVNGIDIPAPGKHPHADLMAGLLVAIASFGFFLLALSGFLALNFIAALMARQIRHIGVIKALGGTRWQIARIYLVQSLLLGSLATVISMPAGVWGSRLLCGYMAMFLNFNITSFSIPLWVFLLAAGAGLMVPLLACSIPVWRTVAIPVCRALGSTGTQSETFGVGWLDRVLAGIGGAARPVLLAVRNSFRRRLRLVLTCITLTCAGMFFITALNLRTSMIKTFDRLFAAERYDLTLYLEQKYPVDKIDRALRAVPGMLAYENWIVADGWVPRQVNAALTPHVSGNPDHGDSQSDEEPGNPFTVIAMPPDSRVFAPVMAQGRRLQAGDTNSVVLNPAMAARNPQMRVGDEVRLRIGPMDKMFRVIGICREPMLPPPVVYVPASVFDAIYPDMANLTQIVLKDSKRTSLELARRQIDPNLERAGIRVSGARSKAEFRSAVDQHVLMIYVFLVLASCIIGSVGGLGLMTTMGINVLERRREIGILRAIGATPKMISAIVIGEAMTMAIMAWGAAVVLAFPLTKVVAAMIGNLLHGGFDFSFAPLGIATSFIASAVLAALASSVAASSAVRVTVREAVS